MKDIFSNHSRKGLQKQLIGLVNYCQKRAAKLVPFPNKNCCFCQKFAIIQMDSF